MEGYLSATILEEIYCYMNWHDLLMYNQVSDRVWRRCYEYFCRDDKFRDSINRYWGDAIFKLPYKIIFLNYFDFSIKHSKVSLHIFMDDRKWALQRAKLGRCLDRCFLNDRKIMLHRVAHHPYFLRCTKEVLIMMGDSLISDRDFVLKAVARNGIVILHVEDSLKYDSEVLSVAAGQLGVETVNDEKETFRRIALTAIRTRKHNVYYDLDPIYQSDPEIRVAAGMDHIETNKIRNADKQITIEFLEKGGYYWKINNNYLYDKDVILASLKYASFDYSPLLMVNEPLKDKADVLKCVEINGLLLKWTTSFQGDQDVVWAATQQNTHAFCYAADVLKQNKEFVLKGLAVSVKV